MFCVVLLDSVVVSGCCFACIFSLLGVVLFVVVCFWVLICLFIFCCWALYCLLFLFVVWLLPCVCYCLFWGVALFVFVCVGGLV